jgi:ribose/xylose/arabinose/galactoside ABC-type transport system permease subunit
MQKGFKGLFTGDHKRLLQNLFQRAGIIIAFILLLIVSSLINNRFLTVSNLLNILRQVAIVGILAIGQTFVILTAGIDLSVGSILGITVVLDAGFIAHLPLIVAIPLGILVGIGFGAVNGTIIAFTRVPAFIVTLGMLSFARGIAYIYSGGTPIPIINETYYHLGNGFLLGIPTPAIILLFTLLVAALVLRYTPFGRCIYGIGSNAAAAHLSGVPVRLYRIVVFAICGFSAALSGLVFSSQLSVGTPVAGVGYELDAIAAVVVGGTNLFGGKGSVLGTFVGVLIVGTLANILNISGVDPFVQPLFKGALIVIAVYIMTRSAGRNEA